MAVSPAVPILAVAFTYWKGTGSAGWFPIFLVGGYLFFLLLGLPVVPLLKRSLLRCVLAGGVVTIAPVLLLNALSMFANPPPRTLETLLAYGLLAAAGCVGGAVFWLIAFAGSREANPEDSRAGLR